MDDEDVSIYRVNWRHGVYGHDTIAILWYNMI